MLRVPRKDECHRKGSAVCARCECGCVSVGRCGVRMCPSVLLRYSQALITTTRSSRLTAFSRACSTPVSSFTGMLPEPKAEMITALQFGMLWIWALSTSPVIPG